MANFLQNEFKKSKPSHSVIQNMLKKLDITYKKASINPQ